LNVLSVISMLWWWYQSWLRTCFSWSPISSHIFKPRFFKKHCTSTNCAFFMLIVFLCVIIRVIIFWKKSGFLLCYIAYIKRKPMKMKFDVENNGLFFTKKRRFLLFFSLILSIRNGSLKNYSLFFKVSLRVFLMKS